MDGVRCKNFILMHINETKLFIFGLVIFWGALKNHEDPLL